MVPITMTMEKLALLWFTILTTWYSCEAYKILVVFPMMGRSHGILGDGYVKYLLDAGHEVTYVTPFPKRDSHPRLHLVDVSDNEKLLGDALSIKSIMNKELNMNDISNLFYLVRLITTSTIGNQNVQELLFDPKQEFDLVIAEWLFSDIYCGFAAVFNCPYIWSSSMEPHWLITDLIDEPVSPAYVPDPHSSHVPPFTFTQRVEELWTQIRTTFLSKFYVESLTIEDYEKFFGPAVAKRGRTLPAFNEMKYNASMVIGNSHVSLGQATRLPQNYIPIAGYHIDAQVKPLPEDLKKLMDNAPNSVVYFSMGSNLKSKEMPDELKRSLLKMFGELKYTVLWKFEEDLPNLPKNVHILHWAPQQSILSHPNCLVFITHGGLLSSTEAVHFGVPIIGIPVFADQFINVDRAVKKGYAKKVELSYTMANDLKETIQEIVGNPKYREKVKELSAIYHDRPIHPAKELVHWVEHVVRTRGAPHLRSPALGVPWYQKMYLDLAAVVLVVLVIVYQVIKRLLSTLLNKKQVVVKGKKSN